MNLILYHPLIVFAFFIAMMIGTANSHAADKHEHGMHADSQMRKLHAMMPMFSVASGKMELALERNDRATVEAEANRILAAIPDLKKSRQHKNPGQHKKYVELASQLESTVKVTVQHFRNGDTVRAKASFAAVTKACSACHARFRD